MAEQPPPLVDSEDYSSDESDGDSWLDDDDEEMLTALDLYNISRGNSFVAAPTGPSADRSTPNPGVTSSTMTNRQHEAAEYCLSRMKQTKGGLEVGHGSGRECLKTWPVR